MLRSRRLIKHHIIIATFSLLHLCSLCFSTHAFTEKAHDDNHNNQLTDSTLSFMCAPVGDNPASVILNKGDTWRINMLSTDGDSELLCTATLGGGARACADCCGSVWAGTAGQLTPQRGWISISKPLARLRASPDGEHSPTGSQFLRQSQHPWEPPQRWEQTREQCGNSLTAPPDWLLICTKPAAWSPPPNLFYHVTS